MNLVQSFGPWALVTGASAGIGRTYAQHLAQRGFHLLLLARRGALLQELAGELRAAHGVQAVPVPLDLREPDFLERLEPHLSGREVGLLINNAAIARTGPFLEHDLQEELDVLALNTRAPMMLAHRLGRPMAKRGRGAIVFLSSTVAFNGGPWIAGYAATKAWNLAIADGLAVELKRQGVVVQCVAPGMTLTEGLRGSVDLDALRLPPMSPDAVVALGLRKLGGSPVVVPGLINQVATQLSQKVLPRRLRHRLMVAVRPFKG